MINSEVECFVHIEKVIGSNPISPTNIMIIRHIKLFFNTFLMIFFCKITFCDNVIKNRYFTISAKNLIIRCTNDLVSSINNNNFINHKLDINNIDENKNLYEFLSKHESYIGTTLEKNQTIDNFLRNCNYDFSNDDYYKKFNEIEFSDKNSKKYKVAEIFLKLIIIELDYEKKIYESFNRYVNNNMERFNKVKSSNKDFFEKFYDAKFFKERAQALIIINKSLLQSISLIIEYYKNKDKKEKIIDFIINQTYNKMLNIDYLWILYTYGFRGTDTLKKGDPGFNPFMSNVFKENYS